MNTLYESPLLFVGHGSPLNILDHQFQKEIAQIFERILSQQKIDEIVAVSAHFVRPLFQIALKKNLDQIYDFYGFPQELYDIKFALEGNEKLSHKLLNDQNLGLKADETWGIDHGLWCVLKTVESDLKHCKLTHLSVSTLLSDREHFEQGVKLHQYAHSKNRLFLFSGDIIHDLRNLNPDPYGDAIKTYLEFENDILYSLVQKNWNFLLNLQTERSLIYQEAINSREHFLPFLMFLGMLKNKQNQEHLIFNQRFQHSTISLTSILNI